MAVAKGQIVCSRFEKRLAVFFGTVDVFLFGHSVRFIRSSGLGERGVVVAAASGRR